MPKVSDENWIATSGAQVLIEVFYEAPQDFGRFQLVSLQPSDLAPTGAKDRAGGASYTVSPTLDISFALHLWCEHAPAQAGVSLRLSQGGVVLQAIDDTGATLNGSKGGPWTELHVDDLNQGDVDTVFFDLVLQAPGA